VLNLLERKKGIRVIKKILNESIKNGKNEKGMKKISNSYSSSTINHSFFKAFFIFLRVIIVS
jgi:hypothetical protein